MEDLSPAKEQLRKEIREAYIFLTKKNNTIPSETLEFMYNAALEKVDILSDNISDNILLARNQKDRIKALSWWYKSVVRNYKFELTKKYYPNRSYNSLTGSEIQKIWKKEVKIIVN